MFVFPLVALCLNEFEMKVFRKLLPLIKAVFCGTITVPKDYEN